MLHLDFETRSRVDLISDGAYVYATDPSTEVLMMGYAFDDEPREVWLPYEYHRYSDTGYNRFQCEVPQRIIGYIASGGTIAAWNANFERLMFWYVLCPDFDIPEPKLEQFHCVAAQARANNLPGNLADCARFIGGEHQKDTRGKALIKLFCVPQANGRFVEPYEEPEQFAEFVSYCGDDVDAERGVMPYMRQMTTNEVQDYQVNERINDRGLMIDRPLAIAAQHYANDEQADLVARIRSLSGDAVQKARGKFITEWVYERLPENMKHHMHTYKGGERKLTFDKEARARLLSDYDEDVLPDVLEVIECSDFAQASSTGKYAAMANRADPETHRVCGSFILNGAGSTGRYSARGLQPHNMPRKGYDRDVADQVRRLMMNNAPRDTLTDASGDNVMQTLKGLLRYAIRAADGHTFVCGDFSQIEGRVNPWLAMGISPAIDRHARAKLAVYADPEVDVYCETASDILGYPVGRDDPERQSYGKVPELSLGFGGGKGAFLGMARNYGVNLLIGEVEKIIKRWRAANPWAQPFWYHLFDAAVKAVIEPGSVTTAGRVSYLYQDEMLGGTLWCLLPSGRLLAYPQARVEWKQNKFGDMAWHLSSAKAAWKPKADETDWPRVTLWPGLLCENVTQGTAADLLRDLLAVLDYEYAAPIVGHAHDEALLEVVEGEADIWAERLHGAMVEGPEWAAGLPLAADIWTGDRYRK